MNRIITKAIGKFINPKISEDLRDPREEADCYFKVAFLLKDILLYEEYVENPEYRYYQYNKPLTKITFRQGYEFIILLSFNEFDKLYSEFINSVNNIKWV